MAILSEQSQVRRTWKKPPMPSAWYVRATEFASRMSGLHRGNTIPCAAESSNTVLVVSSQLERCGQALALEQGALARETPAIARQRAVLSHDSMARNKNRYRIRQDCFCHIASVARVKLCGQGTVIRRLAGGSLTHQRPGGRRSTARPEHPRYEARGRRQPHLSANASSDASSRCLPGNQRQLEILPENIDNVRPIAA